MLYGIRTVSTIYVVAASNIEELEIYKNETPELPDGAEGEVVDILEMLTNPDIKGLKMSPYAIHFSDDRVGDEVVSSHGITILRRVAAVQEHNDMLERARLAEEALKPADRRTLAEIHGIEDNDPWSKRSEELQEADKQENERMKKIRDSGGITSDSFDGEIKEGVSVHKTKVTVDKDMTVQSVDVMATKTVITPYELIVPSSEYLEKILSDLRVPDNRVMEREETRAVIRLHNFQIAQIGRILDSVDFTLVSAGENDGTVLPDIVDGHPDLYLFFSVNVEQPLENMEFLLLSVGADLSDVIATYDRDGKAMFIFVNEQPANDLAAIFEKAKIPAEVVAVNRKGQALLGAGANAKVVDTNKKEVDDPRPWNDRAHELDAMSDEDREKVLGGVKAEEFLFIVQPSAKYRSVITITPRSYFREHGIMWDGEYPVEKLASYQLILKHIEGNRYSCNFDYDLATQYMSRDGFVESLRLQIHVNELDSEAIAARSS